MGCDIHFRVEFYGPVETVVQNDEGEIVVQPEGEFAWQPAERLTENKSRQQTIDSFNEGKFPNWTEETLQELLKEYPPLDIDYDDLFYTGRNYDLFGKLSGVRRDGFLDVCGDSHPRFGTLPEDCCAEIAEELDPEDADLHSHGWATLAELRAVDWSDLHEAGKEYPAGSDLEENYGWSGFGHTLDKMEVVAIEKCGGDTSRVRAVWAYDN